jgi:hypothetical protein
VKLTKLAGLFLSSLLLPLVAGCSDDTASRLALSNIATSVQEHGPETNAFTVGEVNGGAIPLLDPFGISNEQYKDALILSLRANHLLAEDPQTAKYRIDVTLDFDRSGIFDKEVDANIDYRLFSNPTQVPVFEKKIQSTATTKSELKEHAGVVVALLFTRRDDNNAAWKATALVAARDNLGQFFDALLGWTPPGAPQSPVSDWLPPKLRVRTAAALRLSAQPL